MYTKYSCHFIRGVVPGSAMAPPNFGRSVNPISTRGTDYANLHRDKIWADSTTKNTLKYVKTYSVDLEYVFKK